MEININSNGFGNFGMGREGLDMTRIDVKRETLDASQASRLLSASSSFSSDARIADLSSSEPVADVPDAVLSRDDALGRLVGEAFNLPPPPMPDFATTP